MSGGVASVFIDEVDVTDIALEGSATRWLNRPATAQVKLPMGEAIWGPGSLLKIYFQNDADSTPTLFHHGRVLLTETDAGVDTGYTVYNSTDPLELWKWRPVRDSTGDLILPGTTDGQNSDLCNLDGAGGTCSGPAMIQAIFENSCQAGLGPPADAEGPLFLNLGSVAGGGVDLSGAPKDWPMTMAQFATLLVGTGAVDIVVTPIELTADTCSECADAMAYGQLDVYGGNYGTDRTGDVIFRYGADPRNISRLLVNEDMTNITNKLEYYLGPKCDASHWQANIVGTAGQQFPIASVDQAEHNFTVRSDASGVGQGETAVITGSTGNDGTYTVLLSDYDPATDLTTVTVEEAIPDPTADGFLQSDFWTECGDLTGQHAAVVACAGTDCGSTSPADSRGTYGVRMDIRIFDASGDQSVCLQGGEPQGFCFAKKLWLEESWLRQNPQTLLHFTPTRDTGILEFDIGDLITVEAVGMGRNGFAGVQRVYGYTISWDEDSVLTMGEVQVSADNEGFT